MLHPYAAAPGQLPAAALARLQTLAGISLTLAGTTRTGGLELDLAQPLDRPTVAALVSRLRVDRSVLWAEPVSTDATSAAQSFAASAASAEPGDTLMLRLAGDPAPDWASLLPRWSALVGAPLSVDHQIGNVWVLKLQDKVAQGRLGAMAALLQTDAAVQYADPVRRATAMLVPNDPKYNQQWALSDPVGGVNAPPGWDLETGSAATVVAVIDTGITQHPELAGRVLPGYDFISDPASGQRRRRPRQRRVRPGGRDRRTVNAGTASRASRALGTARSSAASSPPTPTTAKASRASTGMRRSFPSACSANAAARSTTSPRAFSGRPESPWPAHRRIRIRRALST